MCSEVSGRGGATNVTGGHVFKADLATVWDLLLNPAALSGCIPGCEKFETVGPEEYQAVMRVGVGAIKGTFTGRIQVADKEPMSRYRLVFEGAGAPGRVRGEGVITLDYKDGATEAHYSGDVEVMGLLASVGQRLMGAATRPLIDQFFQCLERRLGPASEGAFAEAKGEESGTSPS